MSVALLLAGCSLTRHLARHHSNAQLRHIVKEVRTEPEAAATPAVVRMESDGKPLFFAPAARLDDGEQVMSMQIEQVTVTATSRTLPERMGKVDVDFIVKLPRVLQGSCRSVAVVPVLHNNGRREPLQEMTLRGAFFDRVQARDYWQYNRFLDVYAPDSLRAAWAFTRFVKYPYPENVRIDSVRATAADVTYYYTQQVPTAEAGKRLRITLEGYVQGLDGSLYVLPPSDTLDYNISSMLSFTDTATRYVIRVIEKYAEVHDRHYLSFRVNDTRILDTLGDNHRQLGRIEELMQRLSGQKEFFIDSVILTASASPEGSYSRNAALAKARASALRNRLVRRFTGSGMDTAITVRWVAEAWDELTRLLICDDTLPARSEILDLIARIESADRREAELRRRFPQQYRYIKDRFYPLLRNVTLRYYLRRVGMIKDTIHTTEPDTVYAEGVRLLEARRYKDALYILSSYKDRNTAIALLSLGHDRRALEVLATLPDDARVWYLRAIACARLGLHAQALDAFQRACTLDERMKYRAALDPELNEILKYR